jgi:hypothetical protein
MTGKGFFLAGLLTIAGISVQAQKGADQVIGKISFIATQHVYVKFPSTRGILPGDTLFVPGVKPLQPALLVTNISSISCAGTPIGMISLEVTDPLVAFPRSVKSAPVAEPEKQEEKPVNDQITEETKKPPVVPEIKQDIKGRLTLSSFSNLSNTDADNTQRFRYNFSLVANNIADSRFSAETYLSFTHKWTEWDTIRKNPFYALKIYSLALGYRIGQSSSVWLGRKINTKVANIGAVDGVQAEYNVKGISVGALAGTRPDDATYGFNPALFEYGAYVSHHVNGRDGLMENSFAVFNQTNGGKTDRRYLYFQHDNSLVRNLFLFTSCELDLYSMIQEVPSYKPSLTSLYFSMRYRLGPKLSTSLSYDARRNVIYYETYKNFIDRLLEDAMRQGWQLRINYRPWNSVSTGLMGSFRYRDGDLRPTRNMNGFITFSNVPWLKATATLSVNILQTSYLDGKIIGLQLYRDFLAGKLYGTFDYRFVDYTYPVSGASSLQHINELSLSYRFSKKTSLSVNYELTLDQKYQYHRVYLNFNYRF